MFNLNDKKSRFFIKVVISIIHLAMIASIIKIFINFDWLFETPIHHSSVFYLISNFLILLISIGISSHYIVKYYGVDIAKKKETLLHFFINWSAWVLITTSIVSFVLMFAQMGLLLIMALSPNESKYIIIYLFPIFFPVIVIFSSLIFFNTLKKFIIFNIGIVLLFFIVAFLGHLFSPIYPCYVSSSSCLQNLATKKKDPNLCEYKKKELGMNPNSRYNACYVKLYKVGDEKVCQLINDLERKKECQCEMMGICERDKDVVKFIREAIRNWKSSTGSYEGFVESSFGQNKLKVIESHFKEHKRKLKYTFFGDEKKYVIKFIFDESDKFYCGDNKAGWIQFIKIRSDNFSSEADCNKSEDLTNG